MHDNFFKSHYVSFINKVIPIPFGHGKRFSSEKDFSIRLNKAVAMGSINLINDSNNGLDFYDYVSFYKNKKWTHEIRRELYLKRDELKDYYDSYFPNLDSGERKNSAYNPVGVLNQYKMFINDQGITNFPPARTYEGIASGAVMMAQKDAIYDEIGFIEDHNYISFKDLDELCDKIMYYSRNGDNLNKIRESSMELSKSYTHNAVSNNIYDRLLKIYHKGENNE